MLRIENLKVRFGEEEVLRGIDLHVGRGEIACITGPSGCGKSTLLRAVMGFVPACEGCVTVDGTPLSVRTADAIRRRIAWMPQSLSFPSEWVSEMVKMPFTLRANRGTPFSHPLLLDHFRRLGLEKEVLDKRMHEISGGQRQRVMLAVSALLDKPLMVLDEPTSALDHASSLAVISFLQGLVAEGRTVLLVSHDPNFPASGIRTVRMETERKNI